jgi:hypothetical protein
MKWSEPFQKKALGFIFIFSLSPSSGVETFRKRVLIEQNLFEKDKFSTDKDIQVKNSFFYDILIENYGQYNKGGSISVNRELANIIIQLTFLYFVKFSKEKEQVSNFIVKLLIFHTLPDLVVLHMMFKLTMVECF